MIELCCAITSVTRKKRLRGETLNHYYYTTTKLRKQFEKYEMKTLFELLSILKQSAFEKPYPMIRLSRLISEIHRYFEIHINRYLAKFRGLTVHWL